MTRKILRLDSSAQGAESTTRKLLDRVIARLAPAEVVTRDLAADPLPFVTEDWVAARKTPAAERGEEEDRHLALSYALIEELRAADTLVIGVPVYNFTVPAALKAWIDLVALPGETFRYSEAGPKGLLEGKRAILAVASGGTPVGSEMDFASGYMRAFLKFIGIEEVEIVAADALALDPEETLAEAEAQIADLAA